MGARDWANSSSADATIAPRAVARATTTDPNGRWRPFRIVMLRGLYRPKDCAARRVEAKMCGRTPRRNRNAGGTAGGLVRESDGRATLAHRDAARGIGRPSTRARVRHAVVRRRACESGALAYHL